MKVAFVAVAPLKRRMRLSRCSAYTDDTWSTVRVIENTIDFGSARKGSRDLQRMTRWACRGRESKIQPSRSACGVGESVPSEEPRATFTGQLALLRPQKHFHFRTAKPLPVYGSNIVSQFKLIYILILFFLIYFIILLLVPYIPLPHYSTGIPAVPVLPVYTVYTVY